jgi:hypothetical protein
MYLSAEIRWFWPRRAPARMQRWFRVATRAHCAAGGGKTRRDAYLLAVDQSEVGIKARGNRPGVEIKGLVAVLADGVATPPFAAPIELWTKWSVAELPLARTVAVGKQRWVRKFDTAHGAPREVELDAAEQPKDGHWPALGCNVELTRLTIEDEIWWTLGFEAFGRLETVAADLRAVAAAMAARQPPQLGSAQPLSYPAWLAARAAVAQPAGRRTRRR